ncbi:MAG: DedA family protein [Candidatus Mycalebacterium zealandia]|nr:MAG: DedA family protein [Candidatus Mycalebacterium zealandia]
MNFLKRVYRSSVEIFYKPVNFARRVYEMTLGLASKPYAQHYLAAIAFLESFILPIPPDFFLLPMYLAKPSRAFRFAAICSVFSVLGACAGFFLGKFFWELTHEWFLSFIFSEQTFNLVAGKFNENAFEAILLSAFTPIPFKVFTIAAGVFNISFGVLVMGAAIGRSARFFLLAALAWKFGNDIKPFIDRYFGILTLVLTLVLVGFYYFLK